MKIKKSSVQAAKQQPVKASDEFVCAEVPGDSCESAECVGAVATVCDKYAEAICSIQAAIECLACCAKEDPVAKDSIANLSVVLFDLKSNC